MVSDLTPAELAVAELLHQGHWCEDEGPDYGGCDAAMAYGAHARAVVAALRPIIAAETLHEAANAMPIRSAMSRADADVWLHHRAGDIIHAAAGVASIPWRGADCEHLPAWKCDTHGECRGCECGCGTTDAAGLEGRGDDH